MIMDPNLSGISALINGFSVDDLSGSYRNLSNGHKVEEPFVDRNFTHLSSLAPYPDSCIIPAAPLSVVIPVEQSPEDFTAPPSVLIPVEQCPEDFTAPPSVLIPVDQCPEDFTAPPSVVIPEEESPEDCDLSDEVLKFINQILMEEDMDERTCMYQESLALQAAEKPFYDILGKKYPPAPSPSPSPLPLPLPLPLPELDQHHFYCDHDSISPDDHFTSTFSDGNCSGSNGIRDALGSSSISYLGEYKPIWTEAVSSFYSSPYSSQSCLGPSNGVTGVVDGVFGFVESPFGELQVPCLIGGRESRGEEANKFLPNGNELIPYPEKLGLLPGSELKEAPPLLVKVEPIDERGYTPTGVFKGRKHLPGEDPNLEWGRRNKQLAVYTEEAERSEMFDMVLLCDAEGKGESSLSTLREALQNGPDKNGKSNGSTGGKSRGKKQGNKREVVDLSTLLIRCAEAVTKDDRRSANELLKQIKQHSSPYGDGLQRLSHYFADSLEARLDGTGSQRYVGTLSNLRTSASDILRAYHLYLGVCPFKKLSNFFSNRTIFNVAEKATRLHIIDFGILYGFQWPSLIQNLSFRPEGPPKLRITGIELPQNGLRPSARVEETGRRLADYAKKFNVPFEYNAVAQKWETIKLEDLKIDRDEVLAVSCLYRFRNLLDETVVAESSPRNTVLNLIRRMNPDVFVQGVHNGAYGAPFFDTRFKEALFHFSAMFDMLEMNILPESHERMLLEREIFAREAMNVISCEGFERVERPETFKQWQIRNVRAGLEQLPLNPAIMKKAKDKVKSSYHKDFHIGQEGNWMLQGWKGRNIYALSSWRSRQDS